MDEYRNLFTRAVHSHQSGRLAEAESLYRQLLAKDPQHVLALNCLGVILCLSGCSREAAELFARVIPLRAPPSGSFDR